jgi:hypothetical protein
LYEVQHWCELNFVGGNCCPLSPKWLLQVLDEASQIRTIWGERVGVRGVKRVQTLWTPHPNPLPHDFVR